MVRRKTDHFQKMKRIRFYRTRIKINFFCLYNFSETMSDIVKRGVIIWMNRLNN